jgi:ceramide glucosyltransferase
MFHVIKVCLEVALVVLALAGSAYHLVAAYLIREWIGKKAPSAPPPELPAVTILRPIKPGFPQLREKVEMLIAATHPQDQIVLGVSTRLDLELCESVWARHRERDILVMLCQREQTPNIKIAKLIEMSERATHAAWILNDSEALVDAAFLDAFRAEWLESGADAFTCGYRFSHGGDLFQSLDAASILMSLWPGLAVRRKMGAIDFTLGACTGFKRESLEAVGGWAAFAGYLAEDNRIGAALAQSGRRVGLGADVVTLDSDPVSWVDYFEHQIRVAVTYRVSSPAGYFGMLVTHSVSFALLYVALSPGDWKRWFFLGFIFAIRLLTTEWNAEVLRFPLPRRMLTVLAGSIAETFFWVLSWLPVRIVWGGRRFSVSREGLIRI